MTGQWWSAWVVLGLAMGASAAPARPSPSPSPRPSPRVFTEEDLKKTRGSTESGLIKGLASPSPQPSGSPAAALDPEILWRSRAGGAREVIAAAEKRLKDAQTALDSLGAVPSAGQVPSGRDPMAEHQERVAAARTAVDEARSALDVARKALADLEDEARRQQVPPGWLRER